MCMYVCLDVDLCRYVCLNFVFMCICLNVCVMVLKAPYIFSDSVH